MGNSQSSTQLDPKLSKIKYLTCIEVSKDHNILYTAGRIVSMISHEKCPIAIFDFRKNELKGTQSLKSNTTEILHTRNTIIIKVLKIVNLSDSTFLATAGDQNILDFYFIFDESPESFQIGIC